MFPFKTGGVLYVFNTEKAQRLLATVVKNPDSVTEAQNRMHITCVSTFVKVLLIRFDNGYTLDGYYSKDAEILYNAIKQVKKSRRMF